MIDYLQYFFNPAHVLSLRPPVMSQRAVLILAIVFGVFVFIGIISRVMGGRIKDGLKIKALRRLSAWGLTMGIIGYVYVFFAYEGVVLLSARFLLLILGLIAVVWLGAIVRYWLVSLPHARAEIDQQRQFKKYLP